MPLLLIHRPPACLLQFICGAANSCKTSGCSCPEAMPFCSDEGACLAVRNVATVRWGAVHAFDLSNQGGEGEVERFRKRLFAFYCLPHCFGSPLSRYPTSSVLPCRCSSPLASMATQLTRLARSSGSASSQTSWPPLSAPPACPLVSCSAACHRLHSSAFRSSCIVGMPECRPLRSGRLAAWYTKPASSRRASQPALLTFPTLIHHAEVLTARILALRNAAPTRRLLDTSTSTVEVDASLTIDIPQNAQLSQNGATAVVDDLLQVSGKWRPQLANGEDVRAAWQKACNLTSDPERPPAQAVTLTQLG